MGTKIGQQLQDARVALGLTLEDVQHRTRIPCARLAELEADDFTHFANLTYAKSFLALYARFLEVDAGEALRRFPTERAARLGDSVCVPVRRRPDRFGPPVLEPFGHRAFGVALAILSAGGIIALVAVFGDIWNMDHQPAQNPSRSLSDTLARAAEIEAGRADADELDSSSEAIPAPLLAATRRPRTSLVGGLASDEMAPREEYLQAPDLPVLKAQPVDSPATSKRRPREEVRRAAESAPRPTSASNSLSGRRP